MRRFCRSSCSGVFIQRSVRARYAMWWRSIFAMLSGQRCFALPMQISSNCQHNRTVLSLGDVGFRHQQSEERPNPRLQLHLMRLLPHRNKSSQRRRAGSAIASTNGTRSAGRTGRGPSAISFTGCTGRVSRWRWLAKPGRKRRLRTTPPTRIPRRVRTTGIGRPSCKSGCGGARNGRGRGSSDRAQDDAKKEIKVPSRTLSISAAPITLYRAAKSQTMPMPQGSLVVAVIHLRSTEWQQRDEPDCAILEGRVSVLELWCLFSPVWLHL
jgi:hypothetical protein